MSSSRSTGPRQVPPPPNSRAGTAYTRFIPREELQGFANWTPDALGGMAGTHRSPEAGTDAKPGPVDAAAMKAALQAARQSGYESGYRDGLAALENFKHSLAQQMSGQFVPLLQSFTSEIAMLEQHIAATVAQMATQLARQVVRSELATRPELVAEVAQEAVSAVLLSARNIVVQVHPDDHALIAQAAGEALATRGARLSVQHGIERGGCLVETDAGIVDARIEARWNEAVQALATDERWDPAEPPAEGGRVDDRPSR